MSHAHHVAVAIKGLYTSKKLFIISEGDEDLGVIANRLLEDREGALVDFVFLELANLRLVKLRLCLVLVMAVGICQCLFLRLNGSPVPHGCWESSAQNQT